VAISYAGLAGGAPAALAGASIYRITLKDRQTSVQVSNLIQIASGLRNAAGIAVQPSTGDLYIADNGIDGLIDPEEPLSADELDRIPAAAIGGAVQDFGFPDSYTQYRTGTQVGSRGIQPVSVFEPIPATSTNESEGTTQIAFAPAGFTGRQGGLFIGFHGRFDQAGVANEENPVVYEDLATGRYEHFVSNDAPTLGHPDGILTTNAALFIADMCSTGGLSAGDAGTGVIYQVVAQG
jgi:glucose/arabinose dehydrogenase